MQFSLLSNGADSFKKSKESIEKFSELKSDFAYHHLKDALIFLNHGAEILLKYILSKQNESLIFENIKDYMDAKSELFELRKNPTAGFGVNPEEIYKNVFDTKKGKSLKTVTFRVAIQRIQLLCDIEIEEDLIGSLYYINDYRNKVTHYTISLKREEEVELVTRLKGIYDQTLNFLEMHVPGLTEQVDAQRFELSVQEWESQQEAMQDYYWEQQLDAMREDDLESQRMWDARREDDLESQRQWDAIEGYGG